MHAHKRARAHTHTNTHSQALKEGGFHTVLLSGSGATTFCLSDKADADPKAALAKAGLWDVSVCLACVCLSGCFSLSVCVCVCESVSVSVCQCVVA